MTPRTHTTSVCAAQKICNNRHLHFRSREKLASAEEKLPWKKLLAGVHQGASTTSAPSGIPFLSLNVRKAYDSTLLCLFLLCSRKKKPAYTLEAKEHGRGLAGASPGDLLICISGEGVRWQSCLLLIQQQMCLLVITSRAHGKDTALPHSNNTSGDGQSD